MASKSMKALVLRGYGPIESLRVEEHPVPKPGPGEVLVRVHASALNPADFKVAEGTVKFLHNRKFPMVLGYDFSGVAEQVSDGADGVKVGDAVFGFLPYSPFSGMGSFAELLVVKASELAIKPEGISHQQAAAAATPGLTCIQAIRDQGKLKSWKNARVLITGVSGGVGALGVGIASRLGAKVTAVGSGAGLKQAQQLGASEVIDRKSQDIAKAPGEPYDVIFDAAAAFRWTFLRGKLKSGGSFVTTLPSAGFALDKLMSLASSSRANVVMVKSRRKDLELLAELMSNGLTIPIDSVVSLGGVIAGLEKLKSGRVLGRIVVDLLQ